MRTPDRHARTASDPRPERGLRRAARRPVPPAPAGAPAPAVVAPAAPPLSPVPPVGHAPTIRVDGNRFVDGDGAPIRLLGVNFAGVEGPCVDAGFQTGATDAQPGVVFDYQGPDQVV